MKASHKELTNLIACTSSMSIQDTPAGIRRVFTLPSYEGIDGEDEPSHDFYFTQDGDRIEIIWLD